jgi:hypothetical protein
LLDHVAMTSVQRWRKRIMTPAAGWVFALACLLAAAILLPRVLIGNDVGPYQLDQMTAGARASAINSIRSALLQGIGGAAVIAAAYIAWRQLRHNIDDSRAQRELERQAKLTEWFNNAVEHLGSTKLATRLGGIYALDRIGRDSAADRRSCRLCGASGQPGALKWACARMARALVLESGQPLDGLGACLRRLGKVWV